MVDSSQKQEQGVSLSYETLYEMLRREKGRDELQRFPSSFFIDVQAFLDSLRNQARGVHDDEAEKYGLQVKNVKKILKDLYQRREKKIVELALISSRVKNMVVDTSALLEHEKALFSSLMTLLRDQRAEQLSSFVDDDTPLRLSERSSPPLPSYSLMHEEPKALKSSTIASPEGAEGQEEPAMDASRPASETQHPPDLMAVAFLEKVDKFVGPNLEIYGPYIDGHVADLPKQIAEILIQKGKAKMFVALS